MKKIRLILFFLLFALIFSITSYSTEIEKEITSSMEDELIGFKESLPTYVQEYFTESTLNGSYNNLIENELDESRILSYILSYLLADLPSVLKSFSSILALIIISSILSAMQSSISNEGIKASFSICTALCVALTVFNITVSLVKKASSYMQALCNTMTAFAPVMTTLLLMNGGITSAAVSNATMLMFISLTEILLIAGMLPLIKTCLAFSCVKSIGSIDLSGISKTIKSTFTSVTVFIMSIFMFIFSYKSILTQGADSVSIKTARFAISSFVPIVGSSINDALRTVSSSLNTIKSSCGIMAIISIAVLMLPIVINLFLNKLSFSILSTISRALGQNNESAILEEADSSCSFILALVSCTCVLFIFAITIFIKTSIGGGI